MRLSVMESTDCLGKICGQKSPIYPQLPPSFLLELRNISRLQIWLKLPHPTQSDVLMVNLEFFVDLRFGYILIICRVLTIN